MENAAAALKPKPPRGGKCAEELKFIGAILDSAKAEPSACTKSVRRADMDIAQDIRRGAALPPIPISPPGPGSQRPALSNDARNFFDPS
jgi:hypothetical protein